MAKKINTKKIGNCVRGAKPHISTFFEKVFTTFAPCVSVLLVSRAYRRGFCT